MPITGIICEYDPLHLGHKKQIDRIRQWDPEGAVVCLMSGNYVQRGKPAVLDKSLRAAAAIAAGADLVLELPLTASLSSAEGFAGQGVHILGQLCTHLCFGAETARADILMDTAQTLLGSDFSEVLQQKLKTGCSFPAARQEALVAMGLDGSVLETPNNILAVEYCKAIIKKELPLTPLPIHRQGNYHDPKPDPQEPSATAIRALMSAGQPWLEYIPDSCRTIFETGAVHCLQPGERAILARLRSMSEPEFAALPYGSEGLWRKLMHCSRSCATLEELLCAVKSKRYTRSRLDRMVMCAFLGITQKQMDAQVPYVRILALNDTGRGILRNSDPSIPLINAGQAMAHPYWELEKRAGDLYGLFCMGAPEAPGTEQARRVIYMEK